HVRRGRELLGHQRHRPGRVAEKRGNVRRPVGPVSPGDHRHPRRIRRPSADRRGGRYCAADHAAAAHGPTGAAKKEMDRLGISIYDANGETLSAVEIVRQLENGLAGLSMEQRTAAINTLFGAEALAGASIILAEGAQGISEYSVQVHVQGAAAA